MLPPQSYIAWKVCLTILHAVAASSTFLRLWVRFQTRKMWWDDYVAGFTLLLDIAYAIMLWFRFHVPNPTREQELDTIGISWVHSLLYFTIVWSSRVSLSLAIARIFNPGTRVRQWLLALTGSFVAAYVTVCLLTGLTCASGADWPKFQFDYRWCKTGLGGYYISGLVSICFDFIADILLVVCPLILLWRVNLPTIERSLVLVAFSASIFTALAAVVFCIFWYGTFDVGPDRRILMAGAAHIQAAVSLIVCNFLVNIMYVWRCCCRSRRAANQQPSPSAEEEGSSTVPRIQTLELPERGPEFHCTFTPISDHSFNTNSQARTFTPITTHDFLTTRPLTLTSTFESLVRRVGIENTPFRIRKHSIECIRSVP
ncbi:hypothetical protein CC1G_01934 [Coprinopsis cinerea okayama7|uniref:Rhodopsin domain-containing protein n=1 Tax=Coprinopsis cinerea (strain Okayama-7 / 130 / ATCC MYA-4618 / FGSC 9003) TaxID=240176 RepID=A8N604_COPC7|nr:hypothetical protein CC1G_01934 [Coprinopsis cinerea okayama7\|eukprot:XP_001830298.2 hypothetical protein CC1G_01934 [Coprinopsis cinerea okayama7\